MDTALIRAPSPTYTAITPVTRAPDKQEPAAETDLPAEETVRPATATERALRAAPDEQDRDADNPADDRSALERFTPSIKRENRIDPDSESLIFVATDTESGEVVRQIPSETLLRLRAYTETIEAQRTQAETDTETVQTTA